jgi:FeS assembly SUF system regulator
MIKLGRLTDYAVTLLTQMVSEDKGVWAASDLAEKSGLPLPTVSKILKQLAKSDIVAAQRGASGGYRLAKPAAEISVAAIIEAMDGPIALTECSDGGEHSCGVESICPMNGHWNKISRAVRTALEAVSIADMVMPPSLPPRALPRSALEETGGRI